MAEDSDNISRRTWARVMQPVTKIGYADGALDGQTAVFQPSFDIGYEQGLNFGLEVGFKEALSRQHLGINPETLTTPLPQNVNCQICANGVSAQENIGNLYNIQKEKNSEYLLKYNTS